MTENNRTARPNPYLQGSDEAPRTAKEWLIQALIENIKRNEEAADRCERSAMQCDDFTNEGFVAYLAAAAQRHAQYENDRKMQAQLLRADAYATSYRSRLILIIGIGNALSWRGCTAEALMWLYVAQRLLAPPGLMANLDLWREATQAAQFTLCRVADDPVAQAKLAAVLQGC